MLVIAKCHRYAYKAHEHVLRHIVRIMWRARLAQGKPIHQGAPSVHSVLDKLGGSSVYAHFLTTPFA